MLMLLSVHVTSVLFLVRFNNFALIWASIGVTHSYSSRLFLCALAQKYNYLGLQSLLSVSPPGHEDPLDSRPCRRTSHPCQNGVTWFGDQYGSVKEGEMINTLNTLVSQIHTHTHITLLVITQVYTHKVNYQLACQIVNIFHPPFPPFLPPIFLSLLLHPPSLPLILPTTRS